MSDRDDLPQIAERVARAARSAQLKHSDRPCDIDVIGAVGMAGVQNALTSAVYRLKYGNDPQSYRGALAVVEAECRVLSGRRGWEGSVVQFKRLARLTLAYWLNDRCLTCEGRGYETVLGTPYLSDTPCRSCGGTKKAAFPDFPDKVWLDRFDVLLARLEDLERLTGGQVMARLSRQMDEL